ncbi:MAG: hypothetical protein AB1551_01320, partial [Actinomycetota bacterium]
MRNGREPIVSVRLARVLYVAVACLTTALLVIDVTEVFGWEVEETAVGLLGLLLVLPALEQLRRLRIGNVELELAEIEQRIEGVDERLKQEVATLAGEMRDEVGPEVGFRVAAPEIAPGGPLSNLDRIVWVDDRPENNEPFIDELRERYEVELATTTDRGLALTEAGPHRTLVISDAVRTENGQLKYGAGRLLTAQVKADHPEVPVLIFAGPDTVLHHSQELYDAGAQLVTSSFLALSREIRRTT